MYLSCAVLFLLAVTTSRANAQQLNITMEVGTSRRVLLITDQVYFINITVAASAVYKSSAVIVQAHTQKNLLTLVSKQMIMINGSHVGLVQLLSERLDILEYYIMCYSHGNSEDKVEVLIVAQLLGNDVPIPGGCSTVSTLEYDPNLYLTFNEYTTSWNFSDGDQGFNVASQSGPPVCDDRVAPVKNLEYFTYAYYLPERSYSVSHMFDGIDNMLSSSGVISKSHKSGHLLYQTPKKLSYASTPGQGVVYNVVVRDMVTGATSAYVPMVTYACDFYAKIGGCDSLGSVINKVVGALAGMFGLLLCLFGHRFFDIELILLLVVIFSFLLFIVITRHTDWSHIARVLSSVALGVAASIPFILIWCFTGFYYPFVIIFGMFMSFLLSCVLFYTPIGNISYFKYNYVYGLAIACCTVILVLPLILFARVLNITLCAVIGSYGVVFGISSFVQNSLTDIITDLLKHATVPGYSSTIETHPFQFIEIIFTCLWVLLVTAGIMVQVLITRKRRKFPESPYKRFRKWLNPDYDSSSGGHEREPLLSPDSNITDDKGHSHQRWRLLSFDSIRINYGSTRNKDASNR